MTVDAQKQTAVLVDASTRFADMGNEMRLVVNTAAIVVQALWFETLPVEATESGLGAQVDSGP